MLMGRGWLQTADNFHKLKIWISLFKSKLRTPVLREKLLKSFVRKYSVFVRVCALDAVYLHITTRMARVIRQPFHTDGSIIHQI